MPPCCFPLAVSFFKEETHCDHKACRSQQQASERDLTRPGFSRRRLLHFTKEQCGKAVDSDSFSRAFGAGVIGFTVFTALKPLKLYCPEVLDVRPGGDWVLPASSPQP